MFFSTLSNFESLPSRCKNWSSEVLCQNPDGYSNAVTTILMPEGIDADKVRHIILDNFDMSLGTGLAKVKGRVFRSGHLGEIHELTKNRAIASIRMGLALAKVPYQKGGAEKAIAYLTNTGKI